MTNKALEYVREAIEKETTPKYVKKQMEEWRDIAEGRDETYTVSEKKLKQVTTLLRLLIMPKGEKSGQTFYDCALGYQWLFWAAMFCTVRRDDGSRRYEIGVLEIGRKNYKTYTVAVCFILAFLLEPKFSQFFSVAPDGALSRQVREAMIEIIKSSPAIYKYNGDLRWKIRRDDILFKPTESVYQALAYSTSRMDGRLPNMWVADEVGALPSPYPIEAMRSGQITLKNRLGCIISTKYPTIDNPLEAEVEYSKQVLDGTVEDETRFALLFEPDEKTGWETNDLLLRQANPAAEDPTVWETLLQKRAEALAKPLSRENFVTKHCNIIYQGEASEAYIDVEKVRNCRAAVPINWEGRDVYVAIDLSKSDDNTAVAMVSTDSEGNILAKVEPFIPADRIMEKSLAEKVNYQEMINAGLCTPCGNTVIDYGAVEDYVSSLEAKYKVNVISVGFDPWNAMSSAQKLERNGMHCVEIKQHSSVLHPATKLLKEHILEGRFKYERHDLLEINFQNARCVYDTNENLYVSKKRCKGKVDMVVALINAIYLLQQDTVFDDFVVQVF